MIYRTTHAEITTQRPFVCGTKAVVPARCGYFKVVCATCGEGGHTHYTRERAAEVAIRDSSKPCRCGPNGKGCGAS